MSSMPILFLDRSTDGAIPVFLRWCPGEGVSLPFMAEHPTDNTIGSHVPNDIGYVLIGRRQIRWPIRRHPIIPDNRLIDWRCDLLNDIGIAPIGSPGWHGRRGIGPKASSHEGNNKEGLHKSISHRTE